MLLGGLATDLGIGAGAEPARELATDVELHVGVGQQQRLRVGVDRDELDALQAGVDHAVDRVAATAADTDDLDHREVVLRSAEHRVTFLDRFGFPEFGLLVRYYQISGTSTVFRGSATPPKPSTSTSG